jgi:surface protein
LANIIPPSTTNSPNIKYPISFTSTEELYNAVDEYIGAFYGNNPQASDVTTIYGPITDWDVSQLTNLALIFYGGDRSLWNDIGADIYRATIPRTLFNEDVSRWNVSAATTLEGMFAGAINITQLDLSNWDTSRVTTMRGMFYSASLYNGDLGNWNVQSVTDFTGMFAGCSAFQGNGLELWNTLSAQNMRGMFTRTPNFAIDLSSWNTSRVTDLSRMVRHLEYFYWPNLSKVKKKAYAIYILFISLIILHCLIVIYHGMCHK